jgi:hypothetical protein
MDNELMKNEFIVKDKIYLDQVEFHLVVKEGETEKIKDLVKEITSGQAEITVGQADYYSVRDGKIVE